jgi:hypothetical protein
MKFRQFKLRSQFPYADGQLFKNKDGAIRTLKQFGLSWGLLNKENEEYAGLKTGKDLFTYITRNGLTPIKDEKSLDNLAPI